MTTSDKKTWLAGVSTIFHFSLSRMIHGSEVAEFEAHAASLQAQLQERQASWELSGRWCGNESRFKTQARDVSLVLVFIFCIN